MTGEPLERADQGPAGVFKSTPAAESGRDLLTAALCLAVGGMKLRVGLEGSGGQARSLEPYVLKNPSFFRTL